MTDRVHNASQRLPGARSGRRACSIGTGVGEGVIGLVAFKGRGLPYADDWLPSLPHVTQGGVGGGGGSICRWLEGEDGG